MFRTRALAVAAIATTALALTACGSDSLSDGQLELRIGHDVGQRSRRRPGPGRQAARPRSRTPAPSTSAPTPPTSPTSTSTPTARPSSAWTSTSSTRSMAKFGIKTELGPLGVRRDHPRRPERQVRRRRLQLHRQRRPREAGHDGQLLQGRHPVGHPEGQPQGHRPRRRLRQEHRRCRRAPCRPTRTSPSASKACTDAGKPDDQRRSSTPTRPRSPRPCSPARPTPCSSTCRRPSRAVDATSGTLELLGEQYDSAPYGYVLPKEPRPTSAQAIVDALKQLKADGTLRRRSSPSGRPRAAPSATSP